ncbi:MAG: hypothetical protein JKY98_08675, partial [Gammaproteobacteria bacterium]|nr:hypothetical protein [Gammaproteobacteria bacterium]
GKDHKIDFSGMRGSLKIADFTDGRNIDNPRLITDASFSTDSAAGGYQAEQVLTEIIRDALIQGFNKGGAKLVDADEDLRIEGSLLSTEAKLVDRKGVESIQLTLRTNVKLQGGGRTLWETTLFGRGVTPKSDGMVAAVRAALDRMISELVIDDYFLIEVL